MTARVIGLGGQQVGLSSLVECPGCLDTLNLSFGKKKKLLLFYIILWIYTIHYIFVRNCTSIYALSSIPLVFNLHSVSFIYFKRGLCVRPNLKRTKSLPFILHISHEIIFKKSIYETIKGNCFSKQIYNKKRETF